MIRLRSFHLRASRYGGQVAATARQARVLTTTAALLIGGSSSVFACPVCFGAEETSMINASRVGIMALLIVTFAVQGAFVAFFLYLRKRAKLIAEIDLDNEWSELQGGAPRT
jgi:hypothetical protein